MPSSNSRPQRVARTRHFSFYDPLVKTFVAGFIIVCLVMMGILTFFYVEYGRMVEALTAVADNVSAMQRRFMRVASRFCGREA